MIRKSLEKIGWEFPEYVKKSAEPDAEHTSGRSGPDYYTYQINGIWLNSYFWQSVSARGNYYETNEECDVSLIELFYDLAPCLFVDLCHLEINSKELWVWESGIW